MLEEKAEDRPGALPSSEFRDEESLPDAHVPSAYFLFAFPVALLQLGCRIVGPQVVLYCMQSQRCVPRAEHPVYNMTMADVTVSCTSLEKDVRVRPSQGWIVQLVIIDICFVWLFTKAAVKANVSLCLCLDPSNLL